MERTIEDSIRYFTTMRKTPQVDTEIVSIAIDTMKKYQKIQEIVKNTDAMTGSNGYACAFIDIREVVEDGNDDCN